MTSTITAHSATESPAAEDARAAGATRRLLVRLAGASLVAGPLFFLGGMLTSPAQDAETTAAYITALARDPNLTQVSAVLLHYANLFLAVGALVAPLLVRGHRGRVLTLVGTVL